MGYFIFSAALSTARVLISVLATLFFVFYRSVNKPLKRLIHATYGISEGRFSKVRKTVNNEIGRLTTAFNTMVDSLEDKQAEVIGLLDKVKVSERWFRMIFENAPMGICLVGKRGEILESNANMRHIIKFPQEEIVSAPFTSLFDAPKDGAILLDMLRQEGVAQDFETTLKWRNGTGCRVRLVGNVIVIENRMVFIIFAEDITKHTELESHLRQSQKMEAIGNLAGGVAHDLNNLLSPILGYTEMLLMEGDPNDDEHDALEIILNSGKRARDVVRQLLAFSRKQTLAFKPVDLNGIVSNFKKLLRWTIRENIVTRMELTPSPVMIQADIGQIEQVVMNLVVNAQDAMTDGGTLVIETDRVELDKRYAAEHQSVIPGEYVMLAVSDTGHGMAEETRARIFDPFFTTKEKGRGTGLGLATVYGIVKQHGGNIWVYSEPEKGSTFKVYLPATTESRMVVSSKGDNGVAGFGNETILVVEDHAPLRELAVTILKNRGYEVLSAQSGSASFELLDNHRGPLHLLITDVVMPEMNGRELALALTQRFPEMKVIYMSGYTDNVIAHLGILDEGIDFLQKPFTMNDLSARVRDALDRD